MVVHAAFVITLFLAFATSAEQDAATRASQPPIETDAASVFAAVMPPPQQRKNFLVVKTTGKPNICDDYGPKSGTNGDFEEVVADYRRVNTTVWNLEPLLRDLPGVQLVSERELRKESKRLHKKYPGAVSTMTFSAVGFDKSGTLALVYSAFFCGKDCGGGRWHFLRAGPQGWKEIYPPFQNCEWMS